MKTSFQNVPSMTMLTQCERQNQSLFNERDEPKNDIFIDVEQPSGPLSLHNGKNVNNNKKKRSLFHCQQLRLLTRFFPSCVTMMNTFHGLKELLDLTVAPFQNDNKQSNSKVWAVGPAFFIDELSVDYNNSKGVDLVLYKAIVFCRQKTTRTGNHNGKCSNDGKYQGKCYDVESPKALKAKKSVKKKNRAVLQQQTCVML